ncbi:MAG: hypothetical protein ACJ76J_00925 [Thermoanaerobaculia bacterium]
MGKLDIGKLTRQYRRYWLAEKDLQEARAIAHLILDLNLHSRPKEPLDVENRALSLAAVVSYGRAFVESKSEGSVLVASVMPKSVLQRLSREERELHNKLLDLRHKQLAHSDMGPVGLKIGLIKDGDFSMYEVTRVPLSRKEVSLVKKMTEDLIEELLERQEELRKMLPEGHEF